MRATKILIWILFLLGLAIGVAIYTSQFELAIVLALAGVVIELLAVLSAQPRKKGKRRWRRIDFSSPQSPKRL